jgi:acyl-CoA thioesterase-1
MKTLVCHGDSLTEASELEGLSIWPALVKSRIDVNVINTGIGGDTTGGLLSRFYHDVIRHRPDVVLIMGGTNDLWWDIDIRLIRANIFTMTCQAEYHGIVPLIALPLPMVIEKARHQDFAAPEGGYARCLQNLTVLVNTLSLSAAQNDIRCMDFYHLFLNKSGNPVEKYFLEDGLHPNKAGHRLMAQKAVDILKGSFNFS